MRINHQYTHWKIPFLDPLSKFRKTKIKADKNEIKSDDPQHGSTKTGKCICGVLFEFSILDYQNIFSSV